MEIVPIDAPFFFFVDSLLLVRVIVYCFERRIEVGLLESLGE